MWVYRKQLQICFFAYIGQVVFGYTAGWPAPVLSMLRDPEQFPQAPNDMEVNWLVASAHLGVFVGSLLLGSLSNTFGRKTFLIAGGLAISVSYIGLAISKTIPGLLAFRFLGGISAIMIFVVSLVYIGEIASTEIRGILLGSSAIFINFGFLVVYSTGGYASYQVVNYLALALGIVFIGGIIVFATETPIYHILKGREEEAKLALIALNRNEDVEIITDLKLEIHSTANQDWKALFMEKCNRRALLITGILHIMQQASGTGIMGTYTTTIFEIAESSITPYIATIIIGVVQVLSGMITPLFVERCGRKVLLVLSTILTGLSLLVLAIYLYLYDRGHPSIAQLKWLPMMVYIIYCVSYTFGLSVIPSTLVGEMFQMNIRSAGSATVLAITGVSGLISVTTFSYIVIGVGIHVAIAIFSVPCFLAAIFTIFFVPETKGKSLIEVQKMLSK